MNGLSERQGLSALFALAMRAVAEAQVDQTRGTESRYVADTIKEIRTLLKPRNFPLKSLSITLMLFCCQVAEADLRSDAINRGMDKGMRQYHMQQYSRALKQFQQLLQRCPDCDDVRFMISRCQLDLGATEKAESVLEELLQRNPEHQQAWYHLGLIRERLHKYNEALEAYESCLDGLGADHSLFSELQDRIALNQQRQELSEREAGIPDPQPLELVNTGANEYMPAVSVDGSRLYFTSNRNLDSGSSGVSRVEDFWVSRLFNGEWREAENPGKPLNSELSEGSCSFTADGRRVYFTACNRREGLGDCDIFRSDWIDGQWSEPRNLGSPINGAHWDSHPAINADGKKLIFASTRPGGFGESDLWLSELVDGKWTDPINLGEQINSPLREETPFLHSDGRTLYYSSSGLAGFGGLDIFYSLFTKSGWTKPVNLGQPINTAGPDLGFVTPGKGEIGYFASNSRNGSDMDLFTCEVPPCCRPNAAWLLEGLLSDADTEHPLKGRIRLDDPAGAEALRMQWSDEDGYFSFVLPKGSLILSATSPGYFFSSHVIKAEDEKGVLGISLKAIEIGAAVVVDNLLFDFNKATLKIESTPVLMAAKRLLQDNPTLVLELQGHTDSVGGIQYNIDLSLRRAREVRNWLITNNIDPDRLRAVGYGEGHPIAPNSSDEGRTQNRRTEFLVLEF